MVADVLIHCSFFDQCEGGDCPQPRIQTIGIWHLKQALEEANIPFPLPVKILSDSSSSSSDHGVSRKNKHPPSGNLTVKEEEEMDRCKYQGIYSYMVEYGGCFWVFRWSRQGTEQEAQA